MADLLQKMAPIFHFLYAIALQLLSSGLRICLTNSLNLGGFVTCFLNEMQWNQQIVSSKSRL